MERVNCHNQCQGDGNKIFLLFCLFPIAHDHGKVFDTFAFMINKEKKKTLQIEEPGKPRVVGTHV